MAAAARQQELDRKEAQLAALQHEIDDLARTIETQEEMLSVKSEQAQRLESEFVRLEMQAADLERAIAELQSAIHNATGQVPVPEIEPAKRVHVAHYGLAVDDQGLGVVFRIEVEIIGSGEGRVSVDLRDVEFEERFQAAVRTAAAVASEHTGVSISDKDIIIKIENLEDDLLKVVGPSAGASIAAIIVAGLEEKELDPSVLVTGSVSPTGTIGRVGGLVTKADAAVEFGAEKLVVPRGQEFADGRIEVVGVSNMDQLLSHVLRAG